MKDHLPIYRLVPQDTSMKRLAGLGQQIFGLEQNFNLRETRDGLSLRHGERVVELARASGAVWAADESQMWNPSVRAELPSESDALRRAIDFLERSQLLPKLSAPFSYAKPLIGGTHFSLLKDGKREDRRLDIQVIYGALVDNIPIIGGGSDITLTLGHKGDVIGYHGGMRTVTGQFEARTIDPGKIKEQYKSMLGKLPIESLDVSLAYYAAPSFTGQDFLYPVYVCRAVAKFGKQRVPLRQTLLAATDFGPPLALAEPQPVRPRLAKPTGGGQERFKPKEPGRRRSFGTASATRPWEAATSWIGLSGGLAGSQANAQGFVDEWAAAGWHINFNWGDANAFESDWRRNDDTWVDAADFVFYTGHANMNGWVLAKPDDDFLSFTEVGGAPGTPGDLWGQNDLEWAVIAACGPLQDELLSPGGGNVLTRWDGAFDGMHILMGYGAVTYDNTDEGRKLAQYAKGGNTLIQSWFRTAKEIQPATNGFPAPDGPLVWVGAMWAGKAGSDPGSDHAWDYGSVATDPSSPSWLAAMWTTC